MVRKLLGMEKPDYVKSNAILLLAVVFGIYATFALAGTGFFQAPGLVGFLYTRAVLGAIVLVPGSIVHLIFLGWDNTFGTPEAAAPWVKSLNKYWFVIWPVSVLLIGETLVLVQWQLIQLSTQISDLVALLH